VRSGGSAPVHATGRDTRPQLRARAAGYAPTVWRCDRGIAGILEPWPGLPPGAWLAAAPAPRRARAPARAILHPCETSHFLVRGLRRAEPALEQGRNRPGFFPGRTLTQMPEVVPYSFARPCG